MNIIHLKDEIKLPKTLNNIKEDILACARNMIVDEGYENLCMREIASHCGIAVGTLYNYYKSKKEILAEILQAEWQMMLRRIDQRAKYENETVDKLCVVYTEIGVLMKTVHNIWIDNSSAGIEKKEIYNIIRQKEILLNNLKQKIFALIETNNTCKDYEFIADILSRLLIAYSHRRDIPFDRLRPVIASILG